MTGEMKVCSLVYPNIYRDLCSFLFLQYSACVVFKDINVVNQTFVSGFISTKIYGYRFGLLGFLDLRLGLGIGIVWGLRSIKLIIR